MIFILFPLIFLEALLLTQHAECLSLLHGDTYSSASWSKYVNVSPSAYRVGLHSSPPKTIEGVSKVKKQIKQTAIKKNCRRRPK
jgi:hypothetical protein